MAKGKKRSRGIASSSSSLSSSSLILARGDLKSDESGRSSDDGGDNEDARSKLLAKMAASRWDAKADSKEDGGSGGRSEYAMERARRRAEVFDESDLSEDDDDKVEDSEESDAVADEDKKKKRVDEKNGGDNDNDYSDSSSSSSSYSSNEDSSDDEEETSEQLRLTLRDMPLSKLNAMKKNGVNGVPMHRALGLPDPQYIGAWIEGTYRPSAFSNSNNSSKARAVVQEEVPATESRFGSKQKPKKKTAPMEMSSKSQVGRFRQVVAVKKRVTRDPRFDSLSGDFDEDRFEKSYGFINGFREKEIDELHSALHADKQMQRLPKQVRKRRKVRAMTEEERGNALSDLQRLKQDRALVKKKKESREIKSQFKRREREAVAKGKNPYFLNPKDQKQLELERRFETLEAAGNLDKFMEKKRKKNTQKERRMLPSLGFGKN